MTTSLMILGALLAFAAIGSAAGKLAKVPSVIDSMTSVGVRAGQIPLLAVLEIAGGLGLIAGIWIPQLGTLSAACLALYFFGAVVSHLRKRHAFALFAPAFFIFLIAVAVTVLELQR